jgi:hypothetical protein
VLTALLIAHGLIAVALLGAVTHQAVALCARRAGASLHFVGRYAGVSRELYTPAIVVLYVLVLGLGSTLYPTYRTDVRIPFEEMQLAWAIGLFELKEHAGGLGLGLLPLYAQLWRPQFSVSHERDRRLVTLLLAAIVWFDFVTGHVLNNIRGLA